MPEGIEYLHCVQAALDARGLRYQVIDSEGVVRERLTWPLHLPADDRWRALPTGESRAGITGEPATDRIVAFRFAGTAAPDGTSRPQRLLSAFQPGLQTSVWIGLRGPQQRLTVTMAPEPHRSPHFWHGPSVSPGKPFDIRILFHAGMGPGGILCRSEDDQGWSSLAAASPWGVERLRWPERWSIGQGSNGQEDRKFLGVSLKAWASFGRVDEDLES